MSAHREQTGTRELSDEEIRRAWAAAGGNPRLLMYDNLANVQEAIGVGVLRRFAASLPWVAVDPRREYERVREWARAHGVELPGSADEYAEDYAEAANAVVDAPAPPSGETGGRTFSCPLCHRERERGRDHICGAAPPAGETEDGRELREWTLAGPANTISAVVNPGNRFRGPLLEIGEVVHVREIPSEGGA